MIPERTGPTKPRVLLIEASDEAARALEAKLRDTDPSASVRRVATGPSFRALLAEENWDVIVARDGLPALDAVQALRHVRQSGGTLPFVVVTATADAGRAHAAREAGASAVLAAEDEALLAPLLHRILTSLPEGPPEPAGLVHGPRGRGTEGLIDRLPVIIWSTDSAQHVTRLMGAGLPPDLRRADALGHPAAEVLNASASAHERALAGEVVDLEFVLLGRTFHGHIEPLRDAAGSVTGALGVALDLTAAKDAEHALRESEQRYRTLFESPAQGVLFVDAEGVVASVNPAAARMLGRPLGRILGRSIADAEWRAVHEDGSAVPAGQRAALEALRTGQIVRATVVGIYNAAEGDYRWVEECAAPRVAPGASRPFEVCVTWHDITDARRARLALRQSAALFESIAEHAGDLVAILDAHGIVRYQSASWKSALGYPPDSLVGGDGLHLLHPDDVAPARSRLQRVLARPDRRQRLDVRIRHADGSWRTIEAGITNLLAHPDVRGIVVNLRDITERRAAEAEREAEVRQQAAAAQLSTRALADGDVAALIAFAARLVRDSIGAERVHVLRHVPASAVLQVAVQAGEPAVVDAGAGVPAGPGSLGELLLGATEPVILDDLHDGLATEAFGPLAAAGSVVCARIPAPDRPFGVLAAVVVARPEASSGAPRFLQMMANLLGTAITRAGTAEHNRMQGRLLDAVEQSVVTIDREGRVAGWNRGAERLHGYSAAEAMGVPIADLVIPPEQIDQAADILENLRTGQSWAGAFALRRKDGSTFPGLISVAPALDASGVISGFVGVGSDLTAYRRLEDQLRQAQKLEAVGRLAGGVAHDFNNLLTAILGGVEFLLDDFPEAGPVHSDLERIQRAAERAATLTRQLLAFSRKQLLQSRVIDVNRIVRDAEDRLRQAVGASVQLMTRLESPAAWVRADPSQLEQALLDLAANARDAMPDGGRLSLTVRAPAALDPMTADATGADVVIEMADTGTGMTPDVRARIFEPFFTTREPGQGGGLGLSMVYGIIVQSGGSIDVESEPGKGATFRIRLPLAPPAVEEPAAAPADDGARILLVEDDGFVRTLASRALRNAGFRVIEAADAEQAMRLAQEHEGGIDLLFTDVVMPGRSGRELAEQFRSRWPDTPILITSGYTDDPAVHDAVTGRDIELLQKPYSPTVLVHRIRSALAGTRS